MWKNVENAFCFRNVFTDSIPQSKPFRTCLFLSKNSKIKGINGN